MAPDPAGEKRPQGSQDAIPGEEERSSGEAGVAHHRPSSQDVEKSKNGGASTPDLEAAVGTDDDGSSRGEGDDAPAERVRSRASATPSRALSVVPRAERRGLLRHLAVVPEVYRPYDYKNSTKWLITFVTAMAGATAPMGSGLFYPALSDIDAEFGISDTIANLTVALYMLAMGFAPLWWSSFSEVLGRRSIYLISFSLAVVFAILSGFSVDIAMLIVMRMLNGAAGASVQSVGAGTIADIWEPRERGRALAIFYLGPLMGPLIAPIVGGALTEAYGWRSTMWFMAGFAALVLALILFFLPETLSRQKQQPAVPEQLSTTASADGGLSRVSTTRSVQVRTKLAAGLVKKYVVDPFLVLRYLRFPAVAVTVYFAAITFGTLYVLNISVQSSFAAAPYNFGALIVGCLYIPNTLGYLVTSLLGGSWIDRIMVRSARRAGRVDQATGALVYLPEDRFRENAWIAASLYPGALLWYGWTTAYGLPWIVPMVANFFFGVGSMLVFSAATTMLTEFMPRRSSSGVALNNFVRNILACVGGVVAQPIIDGIGNGWLFTILGLFCWVSGNVSIWLLRRNAQKWRLQMDKAMD